MTGIFPALSTASEALPNGEDVPSINLRISSSLPGIATPKKHMPASLQQIRRPWGIVYNNINIPSSVQSTLVWALLELVNSCVIIIN